MLPDPQVTRDEDLRRWRSQFQDVARIADLRPRERAACVGVVERLRIVPQTSLEAVVSDGTGELVAFWRGRANVPGVELGAALRLSGTVTIDRDGARRILNPAWALVAQPYA